MTKMDYLKLLVDEIHSTTVATIGSDGHPQTRIIDMMKKVCISLQQREKHLSRLLPAGIRPLMLPKKLFMPWKKQVQI